VTHSVHTIDITKDKNSISAPVSLHLIVRKIIITSDDIREIKKLDKGKILTELNTYIAANNLLKTRF